MPCASAPVIGKLYCIVNIDNGTLIKQLISLWHDQRKWALELLVNSFDLKRIEDLPRGRREIPGTNYNYVTHGAGVDVYKAESVGGIDFDFDKPEPDSCHRYIV